MVEPSNYFWSVKRKSHGNCNPILPLYRQNVGATSRSRRPLSGTSCIQIVPLLVVLCFFILWWFSYPVNLEVKDGRIIVVPFSDTEVPKFFIGTPVGFAFLAAIATSPYTSHIQSADNQNASELVNGTK